MKSKPCRFRLILLLLTFFLSLPLPVLASEATLFYNEDTAVISIASYQENLYILRYEGLFMYDASTAEEVLVTDTVSGLWSADHYIDVLLADDTGLYGFQPDLMQLICILDENGDLVCKNIFQVEDSYAYDSIFLENHTLYLLETNRNHQVLHAISLPNQTESTLTVNNIIKITAYQNDCAVAITEKRVDGKAYYSLSSVDLHNGSIQELEALDALPFAIVYHAETDFVYMTGIIGTSCLYRWRADTGMEAAAYTIGGDAAAISIFHQNMAAILVDNSIVIRKTEGINQQSVLRIQQPYGRGENYQSFITSYPGIALQFGGNTSITAEEQFIQDIATHASDFDIYLLTDINLLYDIYQKGTGIDLADDAEIYAAVDDMYLPFRNFFLQNGSIYAIPHSVYLTMMGYNSGFFEDFDFDVPANYNDLLTLAQLWIDEYANDYPEIYFNPFANGITLISLLERYADECTGNGEPVVYHTIEFTDVLQKYIHVSTLYSKLPSYSSYDTYVFNVIDAPFIGQDTYMPLSIEQSHLPVISGTDMDLTYYVMNPYSQHQEEARAFIRCAIADWADMVKVVLLQSADTPVENSDYSNTKERLQNEIEELTVLLASDNIEDEKNIQSQLAQKNMALINCEENRWNITQKEIDWYQSFVDRIVINRLNPIPVLQERQGELFSRFLGGNLDAEHFLTLLDEKLAYIKLENQ